MGQRYEYGSADEDDVLVIQGKEYQMQPVGLRAMRKMLNTARDAKKAQVENATDEDRANQGEKAVEEAVDLIVSAVRPHERERLREHLEESVPLPLLLDISRDVMRGFTNLEVQTDLDPTLPPPSSDGSSPTGLPSTGPAHSTGLTL